MAEADLRSFGRTARVCSFFAVPNNKDSGRIEDLCLSSPSFPRVLDCAIQMYECVAAIAKYKIDEQKSISGPYLYMTDASGGRGGRLQLAQLSQLRTNLSEI